MNRCSLIASGEYRKKKETLSMLHHLIVSECTGRIEYLNPFFSMCAKEGEQEAMDIKLTNKI